MNNRTISSAAKQIIHGEKPLKQGAKLLLDGIILNGQEEGYYPSLY